MVLMATIDSNRLHEDDAMNARTIAKELSTLCEHLRDKGLPEEEIQKQIRATDLYEILIARFLEGARALEKNGNTTVDDDGSIMQYADPPALGTYKVAVSDRSHANGARLEATIVNKKEGVQCIAILSAENDGREKRLHVLLPAQFDDNAMIQEAPTIAIDVSSADPEEVEVATLALGKVIDVMNGIKTPGMINWKKRSGTVALSQNETLNAMRSVINRI